MAVPKINCELTTAILVRFLREEAAKFGFTRGVIGLSGGVDSAVAALLAARAYGNRRILAVLMPHRTSRPESRADAEELVRSFDIPYEVCDISAAADALCRDLPEGAQARRGNIMARCRMIVLYDRSAAQRALVVGTSNKTEILLGYSTQFGDSASALNPLGDLYKTQIFDLARHLGAPAAIVDKPPSADLWEGQTDEGELGFTYAEVDRLLYGLVERRYGPERLAAEGFEPAFIERVTRMVRLNQYKRRPPIIAKLGNRTINVDFRYIRDWGAQ